MENTETIAISQAANRKVHKAPERNFGLDLMRCIAIMLVLFNHGLHLYYHILPSFVGNNITLTGHWGVQLFFVLSGFLIGSILIKEIITKDFNRKALLNFWTRRWFRTLPNYYLFLLIYVLLFLVTGPDFWKDRPWKDTFVLNDFRQLFYFPFFLQNFCISDISFMAHSWSLAVEEWFYLTLPCTLMLVLNAARKGTLKQRLFRCFSAMTILFMLTRLAGTLHLLPSYSDLSVIYNLDNLMFGVLMAWLFTYHKENTLQQKNALLGLSMILFTAGLFLQNKFILTGHPSVIWASVTIPLQTIAFACALPWFYSIRLNKKTWISRLVTEISIASYTMYLVHFIILAYIIDTIRLQFHITSAAGSVALFLLFVIISTAVSSVNYRLFEQRMTALRDKFSHH